MSTVSIEDAQARLAQSIEQLSPGEEIVITRDQKPVARLTAAGAPAISQRRLGALKGTVRHMAPDFDASLDDFREHME
jgi:antitoxin (DNA-binding transcriptional repressor) of toxin-antitoxin stability system